MPRKYYQLTDGGRDELAQLTQEWVAFAKAMSALLTPGAISAPTPSEDGI